MSAWGESSVDEVAGGVANVNLNPEAAQKARDLGWTEPIKYDYAAFNANAKPSKGDPSPHWAANAQKYEWDEDFGDVGPPVPELEKILFGDEETTMRKGEKYDV